MMTLLELFNRLKTNNANVKLELTADEFFVISMAISNYEAELEVRKEGASKGHIKELGYRIRNLKTVRGKLAKKSKL